MPGESMREMRFIKLTNCQTLVQPGMGAVTHVFLPRSVFMSELLPTLGYPTQPTLCHKYVSDAFQIEPSL